MSNRHGLSRHISESIKLEVRRRSKFGCVLCRCAVYQYEHIDPEFSEATEHDPTRICLLCGGCHDKVNRGRISKNTVKARYEGIINSNEVRKPFEEFELSANSILVSLGTASFELAKQIIRVNGQELLSILPPSDESSFPTLSGVFCDSTGNETLRISRNLWEGSTDVWDIQVIGQEVCVKSSDGRKALVLRIDPPGKIVVKELNMFFQDCHIVCGSDGLSVGRVHRGSVTYIGVGNFSCVGASIGIDIDIDIDIDTSISNPKVRGIQMIGGQGIVLDGAGIRIAVGASVMNIANLKVWRN